MVFGSRLVPRLAVVSLAMGLSVCGGGSPSGNTPPVTVPTTTPPTTQPAAAPPPSIFACPLGNGSSASKCQRETPTFLAQVDTAINQLARDQPKIFNLNDERGAGGYKVVSVGAFYVGVVENLQKMGFCAGFDGEEIQLKNTNAFNDQYQVLLSDNHVRRGDGSYRSTCYPASFPVGAPGIPGMAPGCSLPGSREIACGREEQPRFLGDVEAAIDELSRTHPEILDPHNVHGGNNWYHINDVNGYFSGLITIMGTKGYCGHFDGEELVVKKTNDFTEHYDIQTADNFARRGLGAYRSSCYPAAF